MKQFLYILTMVSVLLCSMGCSYNTATPIVQAPVTTIQVDSPAPISISTPSSTSSISRTTSPSPANTRTVISSSLMTPTSPMTATPVTFLPTSSITASQSITLAWQTIGGRLVFSSRRFEEDKATDGIHIYVLNLRTNELIRLTHIKPINIEPVWSPNGEQIAFVSGGTTSFDLFVMNADGSGLKSLTDSPGDEGQPVWSPDGKHIAYTNRQEGIYTIHIMNIDNGDTQQLNGENKSDKWPDWSPDGRFLIFEREKFNNFSESGIFLLEVKTGVISQLTPPYAHGKPFYHDPKWIPTDGYFLSLSEYQSDSVICHLCLYEIQGIDNQPKLARIYELVEQSGFLHSRQSPPVWGTDGEWFISTAVNTERQRVGTKQYDTHEEMQSLYDLVFQSSKINLELIGSQYRRIHLEGESFITNNEFYDAFPDWTSTSN